MAATPRRGRLRLELANGGAFEGRSCLEVATHLGKRRRPIAIELHGEGGADAALRPMQPCSALIDFRVELARESAQPLGQSLPNVRHHFRCRQRFPDGFPEPCAGDGFADAQPILAGAAFATG
jgi:hypothetical protein